jgi:hypothetical protein
MKPTDIGKLSSAKATGTRYRWESPTDREGDAWKGPPPHSLAK